MSVESAPPAEQWIIEGKVMVRPRPDGSFDELVLMDGDQCVVHAEMMDNKTLWIGFYPKGEAKRRVVMWIGAAGKLRITAKED